MLWYRHHYNPANGYHTNIIVKSAYVQAVRQAYLYQLSVRTSVRQAYVQGKDQYWRSRYTSSICRHYVLCAIVLHKYILKTYSSMKAPIYIYFLFISIHFVVPDMWGVLKEVEGNACFRVQKNIRRKNVTVVKFFIFKKIQKSKKLRI